MKTATATKKYPTISIRIPHELDKQIRREAKKLGISVGAYIRTTITQQLDGGTTK